MTTEIKSLSEGTYIKCRERVAKYRSKTYGRIEKNGGRFSHRMTNYGGNVNGT
jgi:hypothetical protein